MALGHPGGAHVRAMIEHWLSLARHTPLAILTDFDGTLVELAQTPEEASPDPELLEFLRSIASLPGIRIAIVSGRPHAVLERFFPDASLWLVAEHGAWRRGDGAWHSTIELDPQPIQDLAERLAGVAVSHSGARLERKTISCALHYRQVERHARAAFVVEASVAVDDFLARHADFERIDGKEVIEVRATRRSSPLGAVPDGASIAPGDLGSSCRGSERRA